MNIPEAETIGPASVVGVYLARAIELDCDELEFQYKHGRETVCAMKNGLGVGIASLDPSSKEAEDLRYELYSICKRPRKIAVASEEYLVKARIFDAFGEDAFYVVLKPL